jgi:hypothetical protein
MNQAKAFANRLGGREQVGRICLDEVNNGKAV